MSETTPEPTIIVQKYGGSSVASVDKIKAIAQKVVAAKEAGHRLVVVVSAMGNTTNELIALARQMSEKPERRELDMLLSVGERITMSLLSMAINALGHEAISFTGSQCGIVTNDAHSNARIIEVRPFRVQDELARDRVVIVAGFQGTSYKREVTTLGRGGSDMTAVALAGALGAVACEIYSDVDGVFTSDPRIVVDAARLDAISADEMLELARHGAKVLHDEAVAYAKRNRIALHAKATQLPDGKGTLIRPDGWPDDALATAAIVPRGVASLPKLLWIEGEVANWQDFLDAVKAQEPSVALMHLELGTGPRFSAALDATNCPDLAATEHALRDLLGPNCEVTSSRTNVALVGQDIGRSSRWANAFLANLRSAGVLAHRLVSRQHSIIAFVPLTQRAAAVRAARAVASR